MLLQFTNKANAIPDTLTIQQAFDWHLGDTLQYQKFESINFPSPPYGSGNVYQTYLIPKLIVTGRNDLPDTILYDIQLNNGSIQTIAISQLDSPVTKFGYSLLAPLMGNNSWMGGCGLDYMPTYDSAWSNGQITTYWENLAPLITTYVIYPQFETNWSVLFAKRLGVLQASFGALEYYYNGGSMGLSGSCGLRLVYYKSDSVTWIDSARYFTTVPLETGYNAPKTIVFPNPATTEIIVEVESTPPGAICEIFDFVGRSLRTVKLTNSKINIPTSDFAPGLYWIRICGNQWETVKCFSVHH